MWKKIKRVLSNVIEAMRRPDIQILPGQLAFYFILSLVPTLTIIYYFATFMKISVTDITTYLNVTVSSEIVELLTPNIGSTDFNFSLVILLCVGIYLASNGTASIILAANSIYDIEQKPFLQRKIKAIIMIFLIIMLFVFILLVPVLGSFLFNLFERLTGYGGLMDFLNFLKLPFSWFTIFFFIKLLYTIAPDKEIPSSFVNVGALFTSIGWVIATEIYLSYVKHFAHYNIYYSGLSNLAILMIWIYILALIFVIGMCINYKEELYEIERTRKLKELGNTKNTQIKKDENE
ncbi:MAG TPA: hypothetical protein DCY94_00755 [Firmicutes bacterium]|nr:hypothetical protein [Bacillota bacterium]